MEDPATDIDTNDMAAIDSRILTIERELYYLRKRRNELPPIRRLPTETVVNIFKLLIPSVPDQGDLYAENNPYRIQTMRDTFKFQPEDPSDDGVPWTYDLSWVRLMSVCVWLRQIAIGSRLLWHLAGIKIPGNPKWIELCRSRAEHSVPLLYSQIDLNLGADAFGVKESEISESLSLLRSYITQSSEAMISFASSNRSGESELEDELSETASYSLSQACPSLRYLNLCWRSFSLNRDFLGGRAANLTTLILAQITDMSSVGPQFPSLLNLRVQFSMWARRINLLKLLAWLAVLTSLELLSIECYPEMTTSNRPDSFSPATPISLPHLRIVRLNLRMQQVAIMLSALPLPIVGLDIELMDHTRIRDEGDLEGKTSSDQAFEMILQTVNCFRYQDRPMASLDTLSVILVAPTFTNPHNPRVQLAVRSFPRGVNPDTYASRRFCNFVGPYHGHASWAARVKALHLTSSHIYAGHPFFPNYAKSHMMLECMDLHTVIWEQTNIKHDDVLQLGAWLIQRQQSGRPISLLQIAKLASKEELGWFQELVPRLLQTGIVEKVKWL